MTTDINKIAKIKDKQDTTPCIKKPVGAFLGTCAAISSYIVGVPLVSSVCYVYSANKFGNAIDKCLESRTVKPEKAKILQMEACQDILEAAGVSIANSLVPKNSSCITRLGYCYIGDSVGNSFSDIIKKYSIHEIKESNS
jgi:hypothetical protein